MSKRHRQKKRKRKGIWRGVSAATPRSVFKRMTRDHPDVLQNIEFVLVSSHREDPSIDDVVVLSALRAALFGNEPTEDRAQWIAARLADMREFRADIDDRMWKDGLRVVMDSVRTHSDLRAGSTGYLDFVSEFVG